ncbi:MAG: phosphoribosyltransferase [Methylophilales bacterium 16-45-7]|nr:MAG: phosphoribosyltransferase [Methylophilales bacterium 16-45-7]
MFNLGHLLSKLQYAKCVLCEANAHNTLGICQACWQDLPWQINTCCPQCGLTSSNVTCGQCLSQPPFYDATQALFEYAYPIDALLQAFKYQQQLYLGHMFAQISLKKFQPTDIDCIVPMPMHPARLQERGFNQSLELANGIAKQLHLPVASKHSHRIKNTPPQASLPLKARVKNIKGAFSCDDYFVGKHVAIVDDVMTSGASLNELAKTLKQA